MKRVFNMYTKMVLVFFSTHFFLSFDKQQTNKCLSAPFVFSHSFHFCVHRTAVMHTRRNLFASIEIKTVRSG